MTASEVRRQVSLGCHVFGTDHPLQFRAAEPVSRYGVELERHHDDRNARRERFLGALEHA